MRMDVGGVRIGEQALDRGLEVTPASQIGVDHVARNVEGAQRDRADSQDVRNLVHGAIRRLGPFTNENGVACSVGRVGWLVQVVEKQQGLALLDVPKLDAIGEAGLLVGNQALHAEALQLVVGEPVEAAERRGVETRNLERHGRFSFWAALRLQVCLWRRNASPRSLL